MGRKQPKLSASNISQEITEEPKENEESKENEEIKEVEKTQENPQTSKQNSQTLSDNFRYQIVREAMNRKQNEDYEYVNNANQNKEEKEEER